MLKLLRIFATVDPDNAAVYEGAPKLGMTLEKIATYQTLNKPVAFYVKYRDK